MDANRTVSRVQCCAEDYETTERKDTEFASIKVRKDLAQLLRVYCMFNQKVYNFTEKVLEKELESFKKRLFRLKS